MQLLPLPRSPLPCWILAGCLLLPAACTSTSVPGSMSADGIRPLASVKIKGSHTWEISQAAIAVFREEGFALSSYLGPDIHFEKKGSSLARWSYTDWGAEAVIIRPHVRVIEIEKDLHLVECLVTTDEQRAGSLGGGSRKLSPMSTFTYNGILDKIKRRARAKI